MKIILTTLRNVQPHLYFWQFNSIAKFAHWLSLTKEKFHMANFEFFLEVEATRVQIQVLFRAMVDETLDMFPTSITISLGSFAVEFWRGWLLFENEVFEDLVGCGGLAKHAIFVKTIVAIFTSISHSIVVIFLASIAYVTFLVWIVT